MGEGGDYNRRFGERVPAPPELQIVVEGYGQFLDQYAEDISLGGMFLRSAAPAPVGSLVRFAFRLGRDAPLLNGTGEVVWRREARRGEVGPPGMGIRFVELDPEARKLIERVVAERKKERPVVVGWGEPFETGEGSGAAAGATEDEVFQLPAAAGKEPRPAAEPVTRLPEPEPVTAAGGGEASGDPLADLGRPFPADEELLAVPSPGRDLRHVALIGLALGLVLVIAGAFWWWSGRSERPTGKAVRKAPTAAEPTPPVRMEIGTGGSIWKRDTGEGEGVATPREARQVRPTAPPPAEPSPTATPRRRARSTPFPAPARGLAAVRWRRERGATVVILEPAGRLDPDRIRLLRLDEPPRLLVRVRGIQRPYPDPTIPVGTRQLERIRIGLHRELRPPELYVVLDLASPSVRVRRRGNAVVLEGG